MPKDKAIRELEDLPGIGPTTATKLRAAGIDSLDKIATASPHDISDISGITIEAAKKAVQAAQESTTLTYETGEQFSEKRKMIGKISTGSKDFDELIGGGVETNGITETYGRFASGKTQVGFQLAVNAQLPVGKGGLGGSVLFVDTEGSLPYEETILVEVDGKLQFKEIGEIVEAAIKGAKEIREINGSISVAENKYHTKAISFDPETYKIGKFEISGFIKHPVKRIFRIKLASGREVKTTEYHNFFTLNKDGDLSPTYLKNLSAGEFIAVPALIPAANKRNAIPQEEAEFFGLYVAEGSMIPDDRYKTGHYLVIITSKDPRAKTIVDRFVAKRGLKYHRSKMDFRIYSKALTEELKSCYSMSPYNSYTKKIPNLIFNATDNTKNWFLNGYLIGDGSINEINNTQNADTTSRFLANDLLYILSSLSIPARNQLIFRSGSPSSRGGPSQTYNIHWVPNNLKNRTLEHLPNNHSQIGLLLKAAREESNLRQQDVTPGKTLTPVTQIETGRRNLVSRRKLSLILQHLDPDAKSVKKLKKLIAGDVWFDRIKSIEEVSEEVCYDFEVAPGKAIENFVGGYGGVFLHNTFRPERITSIAKAAAMKPDEVLTNIMLVRATTTEQQILTLDRADKLIQEKNIKLIIIDSLMSLFRSEFVGRGALGERQQKLNQHIHRLQMLADKYSLAAYITNQVMDNPGMMFGDPTTPVGGNIVAHAATTRLYMRKSKEEKRIVRLVDSPNMPEGECVIKITPAGIV